MQQEMEVKKLCQMVVKLFCLSSSNKYAQAKFATESTQNIRTYLRQYSWNLLMRH